MQCLVREGSLYLNLAPSCREVPDPLTPNNLPFFNGLPDE